MNGWGQKIRKW
jgi:hypothetical protein